MTIKEIINLETKEVIKFKATLSHVNDSNRLLSGSFDTIESAKQYINNLSDDSWLPKNIVKVTCINFI